MQTISTSVPGIIVFLSLQSSALAGDCDAILEHGVRNTFKELQSGDLKQSFESNYCYKSDRSTGSSSGKQVGGSYAGYGLNLGQTNSDTKQSRDENCGGSGSNMSDTKYREALQSVADSNIISAWNDCKSHAYGLILDGEINGDDFVLTFTFKSAGPVNHATIHPMPSIRGATCNQLVSDGTIITTGGISEQCTRTSANTPVSIVVNSDFQPAKFFIPKTPVPPPVPPAASHDDEFDLVEYLTQSWFCFGAQPNNFDWHADLVSDNKIRFVRKNTPGYVEPDYNISKIGKNKMRMEADGQIFDYDMSLTGLTLIKYVGPPGGTAVRNWYRCGPWPPR